MCSREPADGAAPVVRSPISHQRTAKVRLRTPDACHWAVLIAEREMVMVSERLSLTEKVLGSVGLILIGLIGWASERPHREALNEVLARVVVGFVTVVGWVVDRLPLPNPPTPNSRRSTAGSWMILPEVAAMKRSSSNSAGRSQSPQPTAQSPLVPLRRIWSR